MHGALRCGDTGLHGPPNGAGSGRTVTEWTITVGEAKLRSANKSFIKIFCERPGRGKADPPTRGSSRPSPGPGPPGPPRRTGQAADTGRLAGRAGPAGPAGPGSGGWLDVKAWVGWGRVGNWAGSGCERRRGRTLGRTPPLMLLLATAHSCSRKCWRACWPAGCMVLSLCRVETSKHWQSWCCQCEADPSVSSRASMSSRCARPRPLRRRGFLGGGGGTKFRRRRRRAAARRQILIGGGEVPKSMAAAARRGESRICS